MNEHAKSWFITFFLAGTALAGLHALLGFVAGGPDLAWFGALVAALAVLGSFATFAFAQRARTSTQLPGMLLGTGLGAVLAVLGALEGGPGLPALYALALALGSVIYVQGYSRFGREPSQTLRPGDPLPPVAFQALDGRWWHNDDLLGTPWVLLFFRGNWCPLCMAQIKEIAAQYQALDRRGVRVALISPQSQAQTEKLAARFAVPLQFWRDPELTAAATLEIVHRNALPAGLGLLGYDPDAVLPTVIVLDANGRVLLADQTDNYRLRPEPATFLAALDEAAAPADAS
ncbi:MAG: redoxin domain-containing protein [Pseudomonadota bacterium]|nr:redoxin domain-containing protein [Pseudomonadota bacterium]